MKTTTVPLSDEQLAEIRGYHERTTHPDWRADSHTGLLLAEVDRLRTENADLASQLANAARSIGGDL